MCRSRSSAIVHYGRRRWCSNSAEEEAVTVRQTLRTNEQVWGCQTGELPSYLIVLPLAVAVMVRWGQPSRWAALLQDAPWHST